MRWKNVPLPKLNSTNVTKSVYENGLEMFCQYFSYYGFGKITIDFKIFTVVIVRLSWHFPPSVSLVSEGPFSVKVSKSKRISHIAIIITRKYDL